MTNSFDAATYLSTLSIGSKLDSIIEQVNTNSPGQQEYNDLCSDILESVKYLTTSSSAKAIIESASYFKNVICQAENWLEPGKIDNISRVMRDNIHGSTSFYTYLYTGNTDLVVGPTVIIGLREAFLEQAKSSKNFLDALNIYRSYEKFRFQVIRFLLGHLEEHLKYKGTSLISSDEELFEPYELEIQGNSILFTHACQILPILDLSLMSLSSCCDLELKLKEISAILSPHDLGPKHICGDTTSLVLQNIVHTAIPEFARFDRSRSKIDAINDSDASKESRLAQLIVAARKRWGDNLNLFKSNSLLKAAYHYTTTTNSTEPTVDLTLSTRSSLGITLKSSSGKILKNYQIAELNSLPPANI